MLQKRARRISENFLTTWETTGPSTLKVKARGSSEILIATIAGLKQLWAQWKYKYMGPTYA